MDVYDFNISNYSHEVLWYVNLIMCRKVYIGLIVRHATLVPDSKCLALRCAAARSALLY